MSMQARERRRPFFTLVLPGVVLLTAAVVAQTPSPQDRAAVVKQSLAQNQAALRQYSWVETTDIALKGEVKKQEQKQCSYGADGKVQKTALPGAAPAPPAAPAGGGRRGGRVKQTIVKNKIDDMKEYMEKVAALVHEYVPPDPQKIQAAESAGRLSMKPAADGAPVQLAVKSYLKEGDALAIGFDTAAKHLTSYSVSSYVEKPKEDDVTLTVTFANLDDGTSFPQRVVLGVKAKQIQVTITNSGYKKSGT